jgi:hypothetical protein
LPEVTINLALTPARDQLEETVRRWASVHHLQLPLPSSRTSGGRVATIRCWR